MTSGESILQELVSKYLIILEDDSDPDVVIVPQLVVEGGNHNKVRHVFFFHVLWTSKGIRMMMSLMKRNLMMRSRMWSGLITSSVNPRKNKTKMIIIKLLLHKRRNMFLSKKHFLLV